MVDIAVSISTAGWVLLTVAWWMPPRDWRTILYSLVCLVMAIEMPWVAKLNAIQDVTPASLAFMWATPWLILAVRVLWLLHRHRKQRQA